MHVCLVIPAPGEHAQHVIEAVRRHASDAVFSSVWAGDPQLRPPAMRDAPWIDLALDDVGGVDWNRLLLALPAAAYELARGSAAIGRKLADSSQSIVLLRVGSVGVTGALDELAAPRGVSIAVRRNAEIAADGLAPTVADLARAGRYSSALIGFAPDATDVAAVITRTVATCGPHDDPGPALAAALDWSSCQINATAGVELVGWSDAGGKQQIAIDVTQLDRPAHRASTGSADASGRRIGAIAG